MDREVALEELRRREPLFHREEFGRTRADFDRMVDRDFREVGASGRVYSREFVLDTLEKRYAGPYDDDWETRDFVCREIAAENFLLTYTLIQRDRVTRRATIWRRTSDGWKAMYHQGTLVKES